jgi:hypothetical protein
MSISASEHSFCLGRQFYLYPPFDHMSAGWSFFWYAEWGSFDLPKAVPPRKCASSGCFDITLTIYLWKLQNFLDLMDERSTVDWAPISRHLQPGGISLCNCRITHNVNNILVCRLFPDLNKTNSLKNVSFLA